MNNTKIVKLFLRACADPNLRDKYCDTALDLALDRGHTEIVKLLREAEAKWTA